jgi:hypothetical protein
MFFILGQDSGKARRASLPDKRSYLRAEGPVGTDARESWAVISSFSGAGSPHFGNHCTLPTAAPCSRSTVVAAGARVPTALMDRSHAAGRSGLLSRLTS